MRRLPARGVPAGRFARDGRFRGGGPRRGFRSLRAADDGLGERRSGAFGVCRTRFRRHRDRRRAGGRPPFGPDRRSRRGAASGAGPLGRGDPRAAVGTAGGACRGVRSDGAGRDAGPDRRDLRPRLPRLGLAGGNLCRLAGAGQYRDTQRIPYRPHPSHERGRRGRHGVGPGRGPVRGFRTDALGPRVARFAPRGRSARLGDVAAAVAGTGVRHGGAAGRASALPVAGRGRAEQHTQQFFADEGRFVPGTACRRSERRRGAFVASDACGRTGRRGRRAGHRSAGDRAGGAAGSRTGSGCRTPRGTWTMWRRRRSTGMSCGIRGR